MDFLFESRQACKVERQWGAWQICTFTEKASVRA